MKSKSLLLVLVSVLFSHPIANSGEPTPESRFERLVLSEAFHSEGADAADLDGDGFTDIVSGPYWYRGPEFRTRSAYAPVKEYSIKGYSDHFFSFTDDFNGDGHVDILSVPIPGGSGVWYENPGPEDARSPWKHHLALKSVDNESPTFVDLTGDGFKELVCIHQGSYGYASPDRSDASAPWQFTPVTDNRGYGRFTHGLGVGDVNGDGKQDLLEKDGWWEQGERADALFQFHPVAFAESGGSQLYAYDFDGDGDNDVLSVQNAHGYGLCWFERRGDDDDFAFVRHTILGASPSDNPYGLAISQMHAVALADIDGDGVKDIVTGKRFWAHGGNDPGATELPVLYWLRTARTRLGVDFQPHLIDPRVGVGTQLTTTDVDGNGHPDIVVGNKLGTFLLLNRGTEEPAPQPGQLAGHTPGNDDFKSFIRSTEPLTPAEELATFVLPPGFEAQLVAAEPDIGKPMNLAFDTRGRLWVTSSVEYPHPAPEGEGHDTIKILEDTDGDGRADKITTFADGLNIPIGLYPYGDGVICYSIPNLWYLRDTDGDDVCDQREVLYGPFDYSRDTHGMCNGFTRGLDGWLYACHGFNNQSTVAGRDGHQVTMHSGNTFRVRLDGSRIEHFTDGQVNPFGMAMDPAGDLFTADCHTKPISLLLRGGVYEGFGKPHDGLGFVPNVMDHLHGSTAIGGIALYHDNVFPDVYRGNAFGGNVMTSRINRNSIQHIGSSVQAREEPDFLISGDSWFRPVDLQIGPDGAMYVADFYNRIIGHYEVDLDHPGRDRFRGRIWRIVFNGGAERRDVSLNRPSTEKPSNRSHAELSLDDALSLLASENLTERMLATDRLSDHFGDQAVTPVRQTLENTNNPNVLVHALWVLHRLGAAGEREILSAADSANARVRSHAIQVIGATDSLSPALRERLTEAISDSDPRVQRAAAMAAAQHASVPAAEALIRVFPEVPDQDVHLKHAIRMSLRDQLQDRDRFQAVTQTLPPQNVALIVDLCLGIRTDFAGEYLAAHLSALGDLPPEKLSTYLSFAARYASSEHLRSIAEMAQQRFSEDKAFQQTLLRSVRDGLRGRGAEVPPVIQQWAASLARSYLGLPPGDDTLPDSTPQIGWTPLPHPSTPNRGNPWVLSTKRNSSDGQQGSKLHSSFPNGESLTGIYRSDVFSLPDQFSFFIAGHDGVPGKPIQNQNKVVIRDAATRSVLKEWSPPRQDTAQPIHWQTGQDAGRDVFVELIDGDTAGAYAWLAVGRFSVPGLNPSRQSEDRRHAAGLIADFRLESLRRPTAQLLSDGRLGRETATAMAEAWVALNSSSRLSAVAESLSVAAVDPPLTRSLIGVLLDGSHDADPDPLGEVMKRATAAEQLRIAAKLGSDREGLELLLGLVEAGKASPRLLTDPSLRGRLESLASDPQRQRLNRLVEDLPDENQALIAVMAQRKASYLGQPGEVSAGQQLFTKHCAVCHQVAGQGTAVGPNLDGVGNRGLDRVIEDVMIPNRNIDAAFRASIVLTDEGSVVSGLVKRTDGAQLVVVDQTGKEINIPSDQIVEQKSVRTSPMPANFHETFDENQARDLLAYLLSLTH
ncbi:c-type cytochrome [Roseiconus nitratireducens]|uniref:C-type cytochrome n=1 Tax=Roseiconus nitratireducens TaxID=2605748 RepID=A0A5M6D6W4_9BACT|nr:PVC-type heme-binding CxxCH protein [Roseiconus nitratireducens]KAA5540925.1 c-type cytochrome [Roseiconus nitratireducens]